MNNPSLKITLTLFLITLSFFTGSSQEAENIYHKEYSKLSFVFQPATHKKGFAYNFDGSTYPSMIMNNDFSYQFGFYYNFAQSGSFNFKTGIIAKEFTSTYDLNISNADSGENDLTDFDLYNQFIISIPFKTDYYLKLNKKLNLTLGAGLNLDLTTGLPGTRSTGVSVIDSQGNERDIFTAVSDNHNNINFSMDLSIGLQYKTKFALIDLSYYSTQLTWYYYSKGDYIIKNLAQSPDKVGRFEINQCFRGVSLNISPKKGWLKKKPKN